MLGLKQRECFGPGQVDAVWEAVYVCSLGTDIVNSDFGVWHTTAESALGVWLVLDLTVGTLQDLQ